MKKTDGFPLISVIVPIYNAEKRLENCIASLIGQTYKNLEILLVNDGSKDGSSRICRNFEREDERVRLIEKENGGEACARNRGLKEARGEFIAFLDADDVAEADLIAVLHKEIREADLSVCSYSEEEEDGHILREKKLPALSWRDGSGLLRFLRLQIPGGVWNKLFRTELIRKYGLRFHEDLKHGPDQLFIGEYLAHARGGRMTDRILYHYIHMKTSISQKDYVKRRFDEARLSWITSAKRLAPYCEGNRELLTAYESFVSYRVQDTLFLMTLFSHKDPSLQRELRSILQKYRRSWKKSDIVSRKTKVLMRLACNFMTGYRLCVRCYGGRGG